MRRVAPAIGLFLLAPFVGEFLLGNLRLDELGIGLILAPMYGAGALLIREVARRTGRGWPTMVLLAIAYAMMEEGPIDQLLWNDSYAGHDLLHGDSYIPALGMSVELTVAIIALHTVWSICVPIALVETITSRRTTPWLHTPGFVVVALVYVVGAVLVFLGNYSEEHFLASPWQIGGVALVIAALVVAAFRPGPAGPAAPANRMGESESRAGAGGVVGEELAERTGLAGPAGSTGRAPAPWVVGAFGLVATSAYWGPSTLVTAGWYEWVNVVTFCVVAGVGVLVVRRWAGLVGWGQGQVFGLAAGATLTYVWTAFPTVPESGGSAVGDLVGNVVFGGIALVVLGVGVRKVGTDHR
ncbi:hypothetical protein GCM10009745_73890 [Kribbella yunnanensis]|uniref:DUF998 domain-containing protein n=1 Tax=Kribbella yunnanensis TaxID=190194 RepID=A0ABN2IZ49_9ACTN